MITAAHLKGAPIAAQKARLVAALIRNKPVADAIDILTYTSKKAAGLIIKVLNSAIANAEHNDGADVDELRVVSIYVDEGPTLKRIRARAKGRANHILKRSCHITVKVGDEE